MTAQDDPLSAGAASDGPAPPPSQIVERLRARPRVDGRYEERGEVGRGGMGAVLRVFDADMRRQLAMKVMLSSGGDAHASKSAESAEHRRAARFLEEAQITSQLDHPGVVPVHELGLDSQGRLYFTMKLVKGRDLREVFQLVRKGEEDWSLTRALGLLLRVCEAVAFAHEKGVIHRDLKPANIMVGRFGEVYVMDWGLAKVLGRPDTHDVRIAKPDATASLVRTERKELSRVPDSPVATMDGDIVGTPCYMPPEQARGKLEDIGPHSDVYSLGSMLYQLLSGEMPYVGADESASPQIVLSMLIQGPPRPIAKIAKHAPDELIAICEKAMARDVRERYPSMLGVAEDLRAFLEGRVVKAHETGAVAEFRKWISRNKGFAGAVATAVVIVVALCGAMVWQQVRATDRLQVAKDEADAARGVAEERRTEAETAQRSAEAASASLRESNAQLDAAKLDAESKEALAQQQSYVANIAAAAASLRFHDLAAAHARLDACPSELRGWEWEYLQARSHPQAATLSGSERGTPGEMRLFQNRPLLVVDPAERFLARATDPESGARTAESTLTLIDLESGAMLASVALGPGLVSSLAISPDGSRVAAAMSSRRIVFVDPTSRAILGSCESRGTPGPALAFDPAGQRIAYANLDHEVVVAAADGGAVLGSQENRTTRFVSVGFSPDGDRIAAGAFDGRVYVLAADGSRPAAVLGDAGAPITHVEWGYDGQRVLASSSATRLLTDSNKPWANTVREWDVASGRLTGLWGEHTSGINWCGYGKGARLVASAGDDSAIRVRDTWNGVTIELPTGGQAVVTAATLRGGHALVTLSRFGEVDLWDTGLGEHHVLHGHVVPATDVEFLSDGQHVLSCARDGSARLWNARTTELVAVLPKVSALEGRTPRLAIVASASPTDARVALGYTDGSVRVFDADSLQLVCEGASDAGATVEELVFDAEGARVAAGRSDGHVAIFDARTGERIVLLRGAEGPVTALAFLAGGRQLAVGTGTGNLVVWDITAQSRLAMLEHLAESVADLDSSSSEGELWAVLPGEIARLRLPTLDVLSRVEFSRASFAIRPIAGGRRYVAAVDGGLAVYGSGGADPLLEFRTQERVLAVAVSRDQRTLVACLDDGTLRAWTSESSSELALARRAALRARELALPHLAQLFETRKLSREEVERELLADESISESLRSAALRLARMTRGEGTLLRADCLDVVRNPKSERADYLVALWRALAMERADPKDDRAVLLEAAARYRLGEIDLASEALARSAALRRSSRSPTEYLAFKALVACRQGRFDDARAEHAKLQLAMATPIEAARLSNNELNAEIAAWLAAAR